MASEWTVTTSESTFRGNILTSIREKFDMVRVYGTSWFYVQSNCIVLYGLYKTVEINSTSN